MVVLNEQIDICAPYEKLAFWVSNFEEEFVKWSPFFKVFFRKKADWKVIRNDMILDNQYLDKILTDGKYPDRIPIEELLKDAK